MNIVVRLGALAAMLCAGAPLAAQEGGGPGEGQETPAAKAPKPDPFAAIPAARPEDVKSIDAIVAAVYSVISGDAGVKRDWNRFRSLFYPGARMIPSGKNPRTGKVGAHIGTPDEYIRANEPFLEQGFHELELGREVEQFGTIAHVFSAYEARRSLADKEPMLRGVNSIQLLNDGTRWWVLTIGWSPETPENSLPEKFTTKTER